MSDHITTYTGVWFYPTNPKPESIDIHDIAHSLSLMCRGNGHVKTFFSVGQHCIFCAKEAEAEGLSPRMILACLLHDASEAYLSDVPRPFKKELPRYNEWENAILDVIYGKYLGSTLNIDEQKQLKRIDDALLYFDIQMLLAEDPKQSEPSVLIKPDYTVRPFDEVENKYLEIFDKYIKRI